jgi:CheY-like chemotaxis protein
MANLLIVDPNGRRRVAMETAAQQAGHRTYSAGSAEEALRLAPIYVPDAILMPDGLPDMSAFEFVRAIRASEKELVRNVLVVTPDAALAGGNSCVAYARSAMPEAMLATLNR